MKKAICINDDTENHELALDLKFLRIYEYEFDGHYDFPYEVYDEFYKIKLSKYACPLSKKEFKKYFSPLEEIYENIN